MNISSLHLKAFYELAQQKNFTRAAKRLAITQSAFSHRILNLESELETTLFIREKQNVRLTETGEHLLRYCEKVSRLESEALADLKGNAESKELIGSLRIGGFSSILRSCLLPALSPLLRKHPKLSLTTVTVELDELLELLKSSSVDFVLSNKVPQSQAMESIFLGYEDNVLVESRTHSQNGNYLDHDSQDVTTNSYFKLRPELAKGIRKRYLDDVYGLIDGVKLGLGRAILPLHLIKNEKDLKILYPNTKLRVPIYLIFYKNTYRTKIEMAAIESIVDHFSKHLVG